jgi:dihydroorotase
MRRYFMDILIKNGRVLDPKNNLDKTSDVYIRGGKIADVGENLNVTAEKVIDATGKWVTPGLIDLHVHLRDPGLTYKEDILSGSRAAIKGGFTTICAMPNTKPAMDNPTLVNETYERIKSSDIDILIIGSATLGQNGDEMADINAMAESGICAVSEDGYSVNSALIMKKALCACKEARLPFFDHCEDLSLVNGGVINEGSTANRFGLPGISNDSEEVIVARDIILSHSVKAKLHLCHMSTAGSVFLIKDAKARGISVTAEACPHHFVLSDEDIDEDNGKYKMNPPLRSLEDVKSIIQGLKDNTIDVIATDHAPHSVDEKKGGFMKSLNGIVGLETALPLSLTYLVEKGHITPLELISKLTSNPAYVLGIDKGHLSIGADADIIVINVTDLYEINPDGFLSKGKSTPFGGFKVKGFAETVIKNGKIIS